MNASGLAVRPLLLRTVGSAAPGGAGRQRPTLLTRPGAAMSFDTPTSSSEDLVNDYNRRMTERMGWGADGRDPFHYHPEAGLYYHFIEADMIVGSQPRSVEDIDELHQAGVNTILNLQQDRDLHYWQVDLAALQQRAKQRGLALVRNPAVDFDPHSLRSTLPAAVTSLERARAAGGTVYVHCTAGLGRSPAVAIASLYWFGDMQLDEAYEYVTTVRPCGPSKDAVRGATYDLLSGRPWEHFKHEPSHGFATLSSRDRDAIRAKLLGHTA